MYVTLWLQILSFNNVKYFTCFIDDITWYSYVYHLKYKSKASLNFQEYKNLVEKQIGKLIKILRKDNKVNIFHLNSRPLVKLMVYISSIYHTLHPKQKKVAEKENTLCWNDSKYDTCSITYNFLDWGHFRMLHIEKEDILINWKNPMNCGHDINAKLIISMNSWVYTLNPHSRQKKKKWYF
jgi:hypothetical protein